MDFRTWWEKEGSVMEEGGCSAETIVSAAWFVATHNKEPDVKICIENLAFDEKVIGIVCRAIADNGALRTTIRG